MLGWAYPLAITLLATLIAAWLSRRRYRIDEDAVHRTLPAWLLPVLAALAAIVAAPFYLGRPPVVIITYAVALLWGLVLAFIDLDVRRLPDRLTLPAYPVAAAALAACSATTGDWSALARAAACAGLGVVAFLLAAFLAELLSPGSGGLGLGDVKLSGTLAGLLGWWGWWPPLYGLLTGFILGGLVAAALLLVRRADRRSHLSFGPALIAGAYVWAVLAPI